MHKVISIPKRQWQFEMLKSSAKEELSALRYLHAGLSIHPKSFHGSAQRQAQFHHSSERWRWKKQMESSPPKERSPPEPQLSQSM